MKSMNFLSISDDVDVRVESSTPMPINVHTRDNALVVLSVSH